MSSQNNVFIDFCLEQRTIEEVAEKMFSLCDENGVLYIPEFDDTDEGELTFQKLKLKWNKEDVKNVIKECEKIESEIKEIFYAFGGTDVLKMEKEEIASFLSADTVSVWEKYLKPNYKKVKDTKLYFVLFYAQKAYKEMRTSGALFFDEINHMLQAMIVSKFAKSVEKAEFLDSKIKERLSNKEYVIKAIESSITGNVFRYASKELKADKDVALAAVIKYGYNLRYVAGEYKNDKAFMLAVVKKAPFSLEYASEELKSDKDIVHTAIQRDGLAFQCASDELKANKEVALAAVSKIGYNIQFVSKELQLDKDVAIVAVKNIGFALQYVSDELKADKDVVLAAVNDFGFVLKYASKKLKEDKDVVIAAVRQDGGALRFASLKLRQDPEVLAACRRQM